MNKCSNMHFFYDKYAGDHTYSNNITSRVTLQILLNSKNLITYDDENAKKFFKTKFNNDVLCDLNTDIYCLHIYTTNLNNKNNNLEDIYIIPSVYTIIGINISKLKKCIQISDIPNIDILKNLFYYHYNYEKYSKYISFNNQYIQLNISSLLILYSIIYIFIYNNNNKKQLDNMASLLYLNKNDSMIKIDDIYYDVNKQIFILNKDDNIINYDVLLLNVSCENVKIDNIIKYNCLCCSKENQQICNKICDVIMILLNIKQNIIFISSNEKLLNYLKFFNMNLKCKLYNIKTNLQFTQYILKNINIEHIIILSENVFDMFHEKNITKNNEKNKFFFELLNKYVIIMCDDLCHKYDIICNFLTNKKIIIYSKNNNLININNLNDTNNYININEMDKIICIYNFLNYSYSVSYQKNTTKFIIEDKYLSIEKYINKNPSSIIKCNITYEKNFFYFFIKMTNDEELIYWLFMDNDKNNKFFCTPFFYYIKKFISSKNNNILLDISDIKYNIEIKNVNMIHNIICSKYEFDMIYSIINKNMLTCCICLRKIQKYIGITQCHHYFCNDCITKHMYNNDNCPYCRANLKEGNLNKYCNIKNNYIYKYEINNQQDFFDKNVGNTKLGTKIMNIVKYISEIYKNNIHIIILSSWNDIIEDLCKIFNKLLNINCHLYKKGKSNWKNNIIFTTKKISDIDYLLKNENEIEKIYIIFLDQYVYGNNKYFINKTIIFNEKYNFINYVIENSFDEFFFKKFI